MKFNKIYSVILLQSLSLACFAQSEMLSLSQCREMALEHNKEIAKAKVQEEQLGFDVKTYKSNFMPRINAMAYDIYSNDHNEFTISGGHLPIYNYVEALGQYVPNITVNPDGSYTLNQYADFPDQKLKYKFQNLFGGGISIMQPIYMGGKITTAYRMALIGKDMAKLNVALTSDEVIVKTEEAYILAVKAKEMAEVAKKYKSLLEELQKNVDSAVRHGLKTRNDQMKVKVKLNEAELNITKAENAYRLACMNLCHYIGKDMNSRIDVDSHTFDTQPQQHILSHDINISNRKEYELLNKKVELADKEIELTRSEFRPNVVMMGSYSYANGIKLAGSKVFNGPAASIAVGVKIPIFDFGEGSNKKQSAKARQHIAQLEQENLNEQMVLEQQQALNNVEESSREIELTQSALLQAEENMRLSKQQYEVGMETLSDYLEAQAIWQSSYAAKVDALCQYNLAWVKYQKSRGEL